MATRTPGTLGPPPRRGRASCQGCLPPPRAHSSIPAWLWGALSHSASSVAAQHGPLARMSLTSSSPPRHTSFCSLAATLPSGECLSCRFLGDRPSPVLSSDPQQGQILREAYGQGQTGPRGPDPQMGLCGLCLFFFRESGKPIPSAPQEQVVLNTDWQASFRGECSLPLSILGHADHQRSLNS